MDVASTHSIDGKDVTARPERGADVAFRILWHEGWPYPVTGHPSRHDEEASHWYVQTRDGSWHPVVRRVAGTALDDAVWEGLQVAVREWLIANARSDRELPPTLTVEVTLHPSPGGKQRVRPVLGGVVNTERGQCYVELATVTPLPKHSGGDVVQHAQNRDPALFSVTLRTTDQPAGVQLQFDAADLLEAVARQYFRLRPTEVPIAQPMPRRSANAETDR
jgi:hypothetical protein